MTKNTILYLGSHHSKIVDLNFGVVPSACMEPFKKYVTRLGGGGFAQKMTKMTKMTKYRGRGYESKSDVTLSKMFQNCSKIILRLTKDSQ